MKKKLKAQNHAKQAQKAALKAARRKAEHKPASRKTVRAQAGVFDSLEEFNFWRAHGVNYILSDYENATWTPMFDIYNIPSPVGAPDLNGVAKAVMDRFGPDSGNWPPEGRSALGWAVSSPETLATYYIEAQRRLKEQSPDEDPRELVQMPHNPVVWGVFDYLKTELAKRSA